MIFNETKPAGPCTAVPGILRYIKDKTSAQSADEACTGLDRSTKSNDVLIRGWLQERTSDLFSMQAKHTASRKLLARRICENVTLTSCTSNKGAGRPLTKRSQHAATAAACPNLQ